MIHGWIQVILKQCLNSKVKSYEVKSYNNYEKHHTFEFDHNNIMFMHITVVSDISDGSSEEQFEFFLSVDGCRDYQHSYCLDPKNKVYKKELKKLKVGALNYLKHKEDKERMERKQDVYCDLSEAAKRCVMKKEDQKIVKDAHRFFNVCTKKTTYAKIESSGFFDKLRKFFLNLPGNDVPKQLSYDDSFHKSISTTEIVLRDTNGFLTVLLDKREKIQSQFDKVQEQDEADQLKQFLLKEIEQYDMLIVKTKQNINRLENKLIFAKKEEQMLVLRHMCEEHNLNVEETLIMLDDSSKCYFEQLMTSTDQKQAYVGLIGYQNDKIT